MKLENFEQFPAWWKREMENSAQRKQKLQDPSGSLEAQLVTLCCGLFS